MEKQVRSGRLTPEQYTSNFCELHPPLNLNQAMKEASRCFFCYDAPCISACPTEINIPSFIRKISTGNLRGAAKDILGQNIMGGTCARVCPVEVLCQQACVRNTAEEKPVEIGALQRHATDILFESGHQLFRRAPETGKRIAIVGAGPAGLSCAHRLAMYGHEATVFEAKPKSGGLNEYGLAAYKMVGGFAQREIDYILQVGGITVQHEKVLGRDIQLDELLRKYDAVFLGIGLGDVNRLPNSELPGIHDAVDFIEKIRQSPLEQLPVGEEVVVIGGGNTAIDIAVQVKKLGAERVHLVYRRGPEHMSATEYEQQVARDAGVFLHYYCSPKSFVGGPDGVKAVVFEKMDGIDGQVRPTGKTVELRADQVFKAIGQKLDPTPFGKSGPQLENGKVSVDEECRTSISGLWAGGDCVKRGEDLTVRAVQDGKIAAESIHHTLMGKKHG